MARETSKEAATAVQDKMLEAVKVGQEASLNAVKEWVDACSSIMPKLPDWADAFTSMIPKAPESATTKVPDLWKLPSVESFVGFSEKLWEAQREFNKGWYEAIAPLGRSAFGAAKSTAATADAKTEATATKATAAAKA